MKRVVAKIFLIFFSVITGVFCTCAFLLTALLVCDMQTDNFARIIPSYEKIDITDTLLKEEWTDGDYALLYRQTGLAPRALDELKGNNQKIKQIQDALFYAGTLVHYDPPPSFATSRDCLKGYTLPIVPLKAGDILVSSACHFYGWRHGHAAIVINSAGSTLECVSLATPSGAGSAGWFQSSANFMVLRLKEEYRESVNPDEVAAGAWENLRGIPYDVTVGVLSPKNQGTSPASTQCGHLVWQAYQNFGLDIDSNGGGVCTPRDIARSPYFDVVQVSGFDLDKLW